MAAWIGWHVLTALELGNFKAFGPKQRVTIAPITLLFGPNSAGKSSVIHSLALMNEAHQVGSLDIFRTTVGGSSIDLGGFRQYVFRRNASNRVELGVELSGASFRAVMPGAESVTVRATFGIPVDDIGNPVQGAAVMLNSYELSINETLLMRMSLRSNSLLRLDLVNAQHPIMLKELNRYGELLVNQPNFSQEEMAGMMPQVTEIVASLKMATGTFLPTGLDDRKGNAFPTSIVDLSNSVKRTAVETSEPVDREDTLATSLSMAINGILSGINSRIGSLIESFTYLGPFRTYPPRHFAFDDTHGEDWFSGGSFAWNVVRTDAAVRARVNAWLSAELLQTPYELSVRRLIAPADVSLQVSAAIEDALRILQDESGDDDLSVASIDAEKIAAHIVDDVLLNEHEVMGVNELVLIDRRTDTLVSHRDVGIGVSQILPVLVSAFAYHNRVIAIEQPEIHLHPALQAELGDVFIDSALGESGNCFLLETHSEHLMLRILRRIRETSAGELPEGMPPIRPQDVSVLYVEPTPFGSTVRHLPITDDGDFEEPWPHGFFAERSRELF